MCCLFKRSREGKSLIYLKPLKVLDAKMLATKLWTTKLLSD